MFEWRARLTAFFFFLMEHHLLERMTDDKLQLLRLEYLADIFFKMKKVSLSLQGKQLEVFIAKMLSFRIKTIMLDNLHPPSYAWQLSKLKEHSDKISSDINEWDFLIFCNEMSTFGRSAQFSEQTFSKWPMHDITK